MTYPRLIFITSKKISMLNVARTNRKNPNIMKKKKILFSQGYWITQVCDDSIYILTIDKGIGCLNDLSKAT